jgi:hypothetical protein
MRFIDLVGQRYGRLCVVDRASNNSQGKTRWNCVCDCGNTKVVTSWDVRSGGTRSCGCFRTEYLKSRNGSSVGNWKGGRTITSKGYVGVRIAGRYRMEHHLVVEQRLGRKLLPTEEVHHKNGVRSDNHDSNLELWIKGHSPGQRAKDLLNWAEEIVRTYQPIKRLLG